MLAPVHGSDNVRTCHACVYVPVCTKGTSFSVSVLKKKLGNAGFPAA